MKDFVVIMPCYIANDQLMKLTETAIQSLGEVPLIIVDNASPMWGGFLRNIAHTYIRNQTNLGYAAAVNQGLRLANSKYIAIANNDIKVSPNWQEVAKEVLDSNVHIYSCHFRMMDYDLDFEYGDQVLYTGKERWCTGSFFVVNGEKKLYYDEHFFNSYDDWDYFLRVRQAGMYTAYTDKACYLHQHSTTQKLIPEREANDQRNREYFKQKHGDYAEALFAKEFPEQMEVAYWRGFAL